MTRFGNPAGHAGLLKNLLALASALPELFEARFALFAQESKAALVQLLVVAICLVLALVLCVLGYVSLSLLPLSVRPIWRESHRCGQPWQPPERIL
jgi:uncharacterized membrane protein YqjE